MEVGEDQILNMHSLRHEKSILGLIITDNSNYFKVKNIINSGDFYHDLHARIFDCLGSLIRKNSFVDAYVVLNAFENDKLLNECGGISYIAELVAGANESVTANYSAKIIFEFSVRRKLFRFGGEIANSALDLSSIHIANSGLEQAERAEEMLHAILDGYNSPVDFIPFSHALSGAIEMMVENFEPDGMKRSLLTGIQDIDDRTGGLHPGDLIVIGGRPSMGKSALSLNIAFNVANQNYGVELYGKEKNKVVAIFSPEMTSEDLSIRILSMSSGVGIEKIRRGEIDCNEFVRVRESAVNISELPLYFDDRNTISIRQISSRSRRIKKQVGLDLIIVDCIQLVKSDLWSSQPNRTQQISDVAIGLKNLAKGLKVPVIAVSQLSRNVEDRGPVPVLRDLRESGVIEDVADGVWFVHRHALYLLQNEPKEGTEAHLNWQDKIESVRNDADIVFAKQRQGQIGSVRLSFEPRTTCFGAKNRCDNME